MSGRSVPSAALALLVFFAGCAAEPAAKSGTIDVGMEASKFVPQDVTVKAGSTIRWTNKDSYAHDVTGKGKAWNSTGGSGGMMKNAVFSKTFDAAGTYEYYCTLHSGGPGTGMWGRVIVT